LKIRNARSSESRPLSVSESCRVVRWSSVVRIRSSSLVTALETVVLASPSSSAAALKEPFSATLAKIAQASKSGICGMVYSPRGGRKSRPDAERSVNTTARI